MELVTVNIDNQTTALTQEGFKSVLIVDFNQDKDVASATGSDGLTGDLLTNVSRFLGNGGTQVFVAGKDFSSGITAGDAVTFLEGVATTTDFYGIVPIFASTHESDLLDDVQTFAIANKKLVIPAFDATDTTTAKTLYSNRNSDRIVAFANKKGSAGNPHESFEGTNGAVAGKCFPKEEGSLTWGNQKVTDVPVSGWTGAEEAQLIDANINYICDVRGAIITQFGKTLGGSHADITRSIDWIEARVIENVTDALINNDKIPYDENGFGTIEDAILQANSQGKTQGMIARGYVTIPALSEIPKQDKANRILRNVKYEVYLTGAIESVIIPITVDLA